MTSRFKVMNIFNIVLLIVALIQYYLLTPLNHPAESYTPIFLTFENGIKLIPGFIIFYISLYILLIFVYIKTLRKKDAMEMSVFLFSLIILWSIVNFFHGFMPTQNDIRPVITETGFFFNAVNALYKSVNPFSTFPNWTAATAVLCTLFYVRSNFSKKGLVIAWCVMICLSPVFLKMSSVLDVLIAVLFAFISYRLANKINNIEITTETVQEIVKAFSVESLIQSVAIGFRDENTLVSLIEGLTRIEKNLTSEDKEELKKVCSELDPPVSSLKEIINNLIITTQVDKQIEKAKEMFAAGEKSYIPNDNDLKQATEELVSIACRPFDNPKFRFVILEIKKKNTQLINNNSIEEAAKERSKDVIYKFESFLESHKNDIPVIEIISNSVNGHVNIDFDEIKSIAKELRKPPYEITADDVWNAYQRTNPDKVKPLGEQKNPANIIALTQFALGKIEVLEPFLDKVAIKFNDWLEKQKIEGKEYTEEELDWLNMMKNYYSTFLEINMTSFNQPPFVNKGGAAKAYKLFGHDLNKILFELNETLA